MHIPHVGVLKCMYSRCVANCGNAPSAVCLYDTVCPIFISQKFCLSGTIQDCLFPFLIFFFAAVIGLLYPCLDSHLGEPHKFKREWASVMRCIAVFVGINHASVVSFRHVPCSTQMHFCYFCDTLFVTVEWKSTPVIN